MLLHYVGGGTEEVEWIAKDSNRLRPVSEEHNGLGDAAGGAAQSSSGRGGDHDSSESAQDSAPHRPMRRSRIEADDAKLAKQLQEEELRSHRAGARKRPLPAAKKSPATTRAPAARSTSRGSATSRGGGRSVAAKSPSKASTAAAKASSQPPVKSARVSSSEKSVLASAGGKKTADAPQPSAEPQEPEGQVSFKLVPSAPDTERSQGMPALSKSHMSLNEDNTVMHIKRKIADEVLPDADDWAKIEIRTPSGMLLGQDHSLRYVRSFLWPKAKGELILYYAQGAESLLAH